MLLLAFQADAWLKQNMSCWSVNSFDFALVQFFTAKNLLQPGNTVLLCIWVDWVCYKIVSADHLRVYIGLLQKKILSSYFIHQMTAI